MTAHRTHLRRTTALAVAVTAATVAGVLTGPAPAGAITTSFPVTARLAVTTDGTQLPSGTKVDQTVLQDGSGRYVFFTTNKPLVPADDNGVWDVYVRDRRAATTTLASAKPDGTPFSATTSILCGVSDTGRYLGFYSPPAGSKDVLRDQVWMLDRTTGAAEVVSLSSSEVISGGSGASGIGPVGQCPISADGRYVAFASSAANIGAVGHTEIFRRDRTTGTTNMMSISSTSVVANADARFPTMTDDGNEVAFESTASNLIANDTNGHKDVFVRAVAAGVTLRASVSDAGAQVTDGDSGAAAIAGNGAWIAFESSGSGLTADETGTTADIYLRNINTTTTELVSVNTAEVQADSISSGPAISDDGRFVTFSSSAQNLYPAKVATNADIFIRDRQLERTDLASRTTGIATGNGQSFNGSVADDGHLVAFISNSTNLVRKDTNGIYDVFVRDFTTDTKPFGSFAALTAQQFTDFFGRPPTGTEATEWKARLTNGEHSPDSAIVAFAHSGAWSGKRAPLVRLYWAFFQRTPDLSGMTYWVGRLESGKTLASVAKQFAASSEFQNTYGAKTNSQFVTLIYQNIFDRDPDPGGLAYWTKKLDTHQKTRGDVMVNFSESSEGKRLLAPEVDTVLVHLGMLRTMPPKALFTTWVLKQQLGAPAADLAQFLRTGAPYAARVTV